MNDVLDTIERELVRAIRRSNARRRRRRTLGFLTGAALATGLTAGAGIAGVTETPIDQWLGSDSPASKPAGAPRVDVAVTDPGGLRWTVTTYRNAIRQIAVAIAPEGLAASRRADVTARSGWVMALIMDRYGPVTGGELEVVRRSGRLHYLFAGTVDARARRVVVELGGERYVATLTPEVVSAPVDVPDDEELLPAGAAAAERVPGEVRMRTYVVTLPPDALAGETVVRAVRETTLEDGSTRRQPSARFCVSARCGLRAPRAAGPGRAG